MIVVHPMPGLSGSAHCAAHGLLEVRYLKGLGGIQRQRGFQCIGLSAPGTLVQQFGFILFATRYRFLARRRCAGGAERRHFDHFAPVDDMGEAEAPSDQPTIAEQASHLLGQGVGGDVKVLRVESQNDVTHATAHQKSLEAGLFQAVQHSQGVGGNI